LVERWFALLTQKQIKRGSHRSTRALEMPIREYVAITNEAPRPFVWTKTGRRDPRQRGEILSANL
jgi:hypothetical protein